VNLGWKKYGEAGKVIDGVCEKAEGTTMGCKDIAYQKESKSLTLWLGGEERREEMGGDSGWDATAIVGDDERSPGLFAHPSFQVGSRMCLIGCLYLNGNYSLSHRKNRRRVWKG
jgi:hypothetical protein